MSRFTHQDIAVKALHTEKLSGMVAMPFPSIDHPQFIFDVFNVSACQILTCIAADIGEVRELLQTKGV